MLNLNHITLENQEHTHRIEDVSFSFPDTGFISIHGNQEDLMLQFAKLLAGLCAPKAGTLQYASTTIERFTQEELCRYRRQYVASLFCDFQLLEQRSLLDNICLCSEENEAELQELLKQWGLYEKKDIWMEDLDFDEHIRMVLLRMQLHHPCMLVVYPPSTPFSQREWNRVYPLLKKMSDTCLIVVVQDSASYAWSDRIIEWKDGYVISDSSTRTLPVPPKMPTVSDFHLEAAMEKRMFSRLRHRFRLQFLLLLLLLPTSLIFLSIALFSTTLDVTEIELLHLKQNHVTSIAVEKHATGDSGVIYEKKYAQLQEEDVQTLKNGLNGDVFASYVPVNTAIALSSNYVFSADGYAVIEMDGIEKAGFDNMVGRYPETIYEVAIPYSCAIDLFSSVYGIQEEDVYLYQTISWYGQLLTVTGIIDDIQPNNNLLLNMNGYAGSGDDISSLSTASLYVVEGFHTQHSMYYQTTFQPSAKRIIDTQTLRSYEADNIYPIPYANAYYFYDGEAFYLDNDGSNHSMVQEDEVLLDFAMALELGYQSQYLRGYRDNGISWEMREQDYCDFVKRWIGRTIEVQAYNIDTAPDDSTVMRKTVTIKGFLFPISWDYDEAYLQREGSILMNKEAIASYMQENSRIESIYFHTETEADMRSALQFLRQHPSYSAYFNRSGLVQFFVVDVKEMGVLLLVSGGLAMLFMLALLVQLLRMLMDEGKKEMSIYYLFGERMDHLKAVYRRYMNAYIFRYTIIGCLLATLIVTVFVMMIYLQLSANATILLSIGLPLLVCVVFLISPLWLIQHLVKHRCIVEELLCDEERGKI